MPSQSIIRDVLIRIDPEHLDRARLKWNGQFTPQDSSLALDGSHPGAQELLCRCLVSVPPEQRRSEHMLAGEIPQSLHVFLNWDIIHAVQT
ncbi:MAG: hypothetical protein ACRD4G_07040 [Bryobacteraceae bacterium]